MEFLEDRDFSKVQSIPEYYKGKTILITGGSGFIGKLLIEKLLYSCGDLDRIYLLMRSKKGVRSEDRLDDIYALPCFDRLRSEKPEIFKQKVFVVSGDVSEPGLGLSDEDRTLLLNRLNVIFHVAASVRFDDPLTFAVRLNLRGTKEITDLAREVRDLSCFIHVSTSYSNTNRATIEEQMYPPHADWRSLLEVCDSLDEHTLRVFTPKYLGELPNTYVFTKQLAEHVVYEQKGQLPAVIIRPSIVIASIEEPMPGWVENFNGPVGMFVACGKGIMRSIHTKPSIESDYMPVDTSVKHIIAAAWLRGTKQLEPTDDIPIFNCCSGQFNKMPIEELIDMSKRLGRDFPLNDALWVIGGKITTNETMHYIKVLFQHLLPAVIVDMILWLLGKKTLLVKVQRRIYTANLALKYYITQQWTFANNNFVRLRTALKPEDKQQFYYEVENVDVTDYIVKCCIGGRKYLLKEKDEDMPRAKAHMNRLEFLEKCLKVIFYGYLLYWGSQLFMKFHEEYLNDFLVL